MPQRFLFQSTAGRRLNPFPGGAVRLPTLPAVTGGYPAVWFLSRLIAGYAGPCLRVLRASDSAQQDIGFDATGLVDMGAALAFGAGSELRVVTVYDQSGNGRHVTGSASAPSLLPILTTQRAAYGPAFPAFPLILQPGLVYPYTANQVAGLAIPSSLSVDQRNVAMFDVCAPATAIRLASISGLGGLSGTSRLSNAVQPGQAGFGVFTYSAGGTLTIRTAGYASAPRSNLQVLGFVSRDSGFTVFNQDISASYAALDSRTLTGGHLGSGNGSNTSAYYTGDRLGAVITTGAITSADEAAIRSTLTIIAGSAKRSTRFILVGSSTPEGRGANNLVAGKYSTQSYFRLALGGLNREIDAWNLGQSGQLSTAVLNNFQTEVAPLITPNTIVSINVGGNDIAVNNDSGPTVGGRLRQIAQLARSAGPLAVMMETLGQRTDITGSNGTPQKAQALADLNALIRDRAYMGIDAFADIDAIVALQNPGPSNPNYVVDADGNYTHRSNAGQVLSAQANTPVIQGLVR